MSRIHIGLLLLLSTLWGASFLFVGVAIQEIAPLHLVFLRVAIAAPVMLVLLRMNGVSLPSGLKAWSPFLIMGLLNNVIPFTAIFYAQTEISVSLTAIVISTTPIFTFVILALFGAEKLVKNKLTGAVIGALGVVILLDPRSFSFDTTTFGVVLNMCAAISYAFAALWAKRRLLGVPPLQAASYQIIASTMILLTIMPFTLSELPDALPSIPALLSVMALAFLSTALGYLIFFRLITETGPSNAVLTTLLVPVSASFLGWLIMDDVLSLHQFIGAATIAIALLIIDGRLAKKLKTILIAR